MSDHTPEFPGVDPLLSSTLSGPVPTLSRDFNRRVMQSVRPRRLSRAGLVVLVLYALASGALSVWLMRQADLGWNLIALSSSVPLLVVAVTFRRSVANVLLGRASRRKAISPA